jgi:tRNA (guanine-N7-)-methyltransferase
MQASSHPVQSAQSALHPRLHETLRRHFDNPWQQPLHAATQHAFALLQVMLGDVPPPLILDSGCGTAVSTLRLAELHPGHCVVGVDQSAVRLQRLAPEGIAQIGNAIIVRAELASFWRLFVAAGMQAERHYLLYPNPWPKAAHLARRWQGHPVFPTLMRSAQQFELRSNWRVYVEEFAYALRFAGHLHAEAETLQPDAPLTPFERKYRGSGHALWRVVTRMQERREPRCSCSAA